MSLADSGELPRGRGATVPPPFVGAEPGEAPPSARRRSALDFLGRELRALEVDSMLKKQMEGELAEAKEALRRSHELNEMLNRRIELLEDTLRRERAARGDAEPLEPAPVPRAPTSLASAAARLPPAATVAASAQPGSEPPSAGADDFDFDEALRAMEMRDVPPQQDGSRREPIVARVS